MIKTKPKICNDVHETFDVIVGNLEKNFEELKRRINDHVAMSEMYGGKNGPVTARSVYNKKYTLSEKEHVQGCYVLMKDGEPFYVGISQKVFHRLHQHVKGKISATLASKLAGNRDEKKFTKAKECLLETHVAIVEIDNIIEKYLFEVYAAMKLKTGEYNSFQTH